MTTRTIIKITLPLIIALLWLVMSIGWPVMASSNISDVVSSLSSIPQKKGEFIWVTVIASPGADIEPFFSGTVYRSSIAGMEQWAGKVRASSLNNLKKQPAVIHVNTPTSLPTAPEPDPAHSSPPQKLKGQALIVVARSQQGVSKPLTTQSWYENDTQGVRQTWNSLGITGTGAMIAVIDSGVDFANPALTGRYAVQPATSSGNQSYAGWPIAFDDFSLSTYIADPNRAWSSGNWGSGYINANQAIIGSGVFSFADPLTPTHIYTTPGTSLSGRYLLGHHPDTTISHVPVLVADETSAGLYDAVYIDIDYNGIFETKLTRNQPVGSLDTNGDGVPDVSAGMLYWIADGINPPPGATSVYGNSVPVPSAGTLLAFMIDDVWKSGNGHGTRVASSAVGNDGGVFTSTADARIASFYNSSYGALVQGPAPGAKVVAIGNVYIGGAASSNYIFTMLGYDGLPNSGDEPHIVNISYGSSRIDNDGWEWESRFISSLNLAYGDNSPLYIVSSGNGGFGYGTIIPPSPATGLTVGASTQYGTLNAWGISETVSLPARVNIGNIASFSGRGMGADGTSGVDISANGMAGTGAYPLNGTGDGTKAFSHWSGTSRSSPVVSGMAALVMQGFTRKYGRLPTRTELSRLLLNGAKDLGYDPMSQGAGQANAFRSTQKALGLSSTIDPPVAVFGTYRGNRYPSFAAGLSRGQNDKLVFTVTNPSPSPATFQIATEQLVEVARYTIITSTIHDTATNYFFGMPDYALNLTPYVKNHPQASLMIVRLTVPFEHFNTVPPTPATPSNVWRLITYNWWDDNGNGKWWSDLNGNGRINVPEEIDGGDEWMRFDYSRLGSTQQEIQIGFPYQKSIGAGSSGIWAGAAHYKQNGSNNSTSLTYELIFYEKRIWSDVTLSKNQLVVPAGGQSSFQATVTVNANSSYGLHQGMIVISNTTQNDRSNVPLTWQVWPDVAQGAVLGDVPDTNSPYSNNSVHGGFNWYSRSEAGDWRFFGFDLKNPPAGSVIMARNIWQDYPTDIDTIFFGPTADDFSAQNPDWFGAYSLELVGGSYRSPSRPVWGFQTATGGTEELVSTPAQDGLYMLVNQAVALGGHQSSTPFTTSLGLAYVKPYPLTVSPSCNLPCTVTATFQASLDIPTGLTGAYSFGWFTPTLQSSAIITGQTVTHTLILTRSMYRLDATLRNVSGASDLDLYLYDDLGTVAGTWDTGDGLMELTTGIGVDKSLQERAKLIIGTYFIRVDGQAVNNGGGNYSLETLLTPHNSSGAMVYGGLPSNVIANQPVTFTVQITHPIELKQQGLLVFGLPKLPYALEIPVVAEQIPAFTLSKSSTPPPGTAIAVGERITYSIIITNSGDIATNFVLTDIIPANTSYISGSASSSWATIAGQKPLVITAATFTGGGQILTASLVVTVSGWTNTITNQATIVSQQTAQQLSNQVSHPLAPITATIPIFTLSKSSTPPPGTAIAVGERITYSIIITNSGDIATNFVLTDIIPANTSYISGSASSSWATIAGQTPLVITAATFAGGGQILTATLVVTASGWTDIITNQATIASQQTGQQISNQVSHLLAPITATIPLFSLSKSSSPPPGTAIALGERITYSIIITNSGDVATNFVLTDIIPANTGYISGSASGWATVAGQKPLVITAATFTGGGQLLTASLVVTVSGWTNTITNQATIASQQTGQQLSNQVSHPLAPITATIPISGGGISIPGLINLSMGSNLFSDTVIITLARQPITSTGVLSSTGFFFTMQAIYQSSGLPALLQAGQRYTVSVSYNPANLPVGADETSLSLYYWDEQGSEWVKETTNVVATNRITATPNHFSLWAILVGTATRNDIFLPVILKN